MKWSPDWFPLPGQGSVRPVNRRLAVVSRTKNNLDLFVIGNDDRVWSTFWTEHGWNADWFPLPGQARFDHLTQQVVVVSRTPTNLDLFVIGNDNHVWSTFWPVQGSGNWNPDWFPLPGQAVFDREKQRLSVVSRAPDNLDLFVIGNDDRVWSTFWPIRGRKWNPDWFPLPGQARFGHLTQQVVAVARTPTNLDLFVIGNDGHVYSTFWPVQGNGNWNAEWFPLPGQAVFDRDNQRLAVVSRTKNNLDLFVIGNDNHAWSTFWAPREPMTLDVHSDQTSTTVPLQVRSAHCCERRHRERNELELNQERSAPAEHRRASACGNSLGPDHRNQRSRRLWDHGQPDRADRSRSAHNAHASISKSWR